MTDPKVVWEFLGGPHMNEWKKAGSRAMADARTEVSDLRASYDGGEPKTPEEWLDEMEQAGVALSSRPVRSYGEDDRMALWKTYEAAYAVLKDLLSGGEG